MAGEQGPDGVTQVGLYRVRIGGRCVDRDAICSDADTRTDMFSSGDVGVEEDSGMLKLSDIIYDSELCLWHPK